MSRKDYQLIAGAILKVKQNRTDGQEDLRAEVAEDVLRELVATLGYKLEGDNSKFDYDKFKEACGL